MSKNYKQLTGKYYVYAYQQPGDVMLGQGFETKQAMLAWISWWITAKPRGEHIKFEVIKR